MGAQGLTPGARRAARSVQKMNRTTTLPPPVPIAGAIMQSCFARSTTQPSEWSRYMGTNSSVTKSSPVMRRYVAAYMAWFLAVGMMAWAALLWYKRVEEIGYRELASRIRAREVATEVTEAPEDGE